MAFQHGRGHIRREERSDKYNIMLYNIMVYFNTMYGPLRETAARHRNDAKTPRPSSRSRGAIANTSDFENDRPRPRPPLESRRFRKRAAPSQEFRRETQTSGSRFRKRLFSQRVADERLASASASAAAMAALALALASFVAALDSFGGWRRRAGVRRGRGGRPCF